MADTLVMRATSLAASAALLTLAGVAALSMSYTVSQIIARPDPAPIVTITPPPVVPPAPAPPSVQRTSHVERAAPPTDTPAATNTMPTTASTGVPTADPGPALITSPHWLREPRDLARYYPARAITRQMQGVAELDCLVNTAGQLECVVVSETPASWGFGAAALRIAQDYRMAPATRDGAPIQGRYHMRIPFRLSR
jgi:protein TonB